MAELGFIGTYTGEKNGRGRGIYAFSFDPEKGVIEDMRLAVETINPSWLCLSPSGEYLYSVNETSGFRGEVSGALSAYKIRRDGGLEYINQVKSCGIAPCHLAIDDSETIIICSNYSSGVLSVYPVLKDRGVDEAAQVIGLEGKGPNPSRQDGPHAHSFWFDRDYTRGFACDLGTDRVMCYDVDVHGAAPLKPADPPWYKSSSGAGPRHMAFNPAGGTAYLLNELNSTIEVLKSYPFERIQTISTLPEGFRGNNTAAAIRVSPDGNFVYASNRGHDSIAVFKARKEGTLELRSITGSGGATPRDFNIDPAGNFLLAANQGSDNLLVFGIDKKEGGIEKTGEYSAPSPVCVVFRNRNPRAAR
ncbi:MAG: lactonase family protein [Treponema sp.]|jgi:6-phosphogluconolactonase|nr:lactonase family protein [Treponema sp.]